MFCKFLESWKKNQGIEKMWEGMGVKRMRKCRKRSVEGVERDDGKFWKGVGFC